MFLSYSENRKGYQLYDFQKQRVVFSHDVVFNEIASGFEKEPNDLKPYVKIDLEGIDSRTSAEPDEERAESGNEQEESTENLVQLRRSSRERRRPDFYGTYVNATDSVVEPVTVEEALSSVDNTGKLIPGSRPIS